MRRAVDRYPSLSLVVVLLVLWQIVFWLVGRNALLPPVETGLYLARLLQTRAGANLFLGRSLTFPNREHTWPQCSHLTGV